MKKKLFILCALVLTTALLLTVFVGCGKKETIDASTTGSAMDGTPGSASDGTPGNASDGTPGSASDSGSGSAADSASGSTPGNAPAGTGSNTGSVDVLTTYVNKTEIVNVTDENGEVMTDANGNNVTQAIPVTNANGQKVTEAVRINGVELATGDFDEGWY